MKRVVVTEPVHPDGMALLRARGDLAVDAFDHTSDPAAFRDAIKGASAVLVRTTPLDAELLGSASALEMVSKHGVGCDNIDVAHMTERGLPVAVSADANAVSVAEHTLTLLLACAKRLLDQDAAARRADWGYRSRTGAIQLSGKTALVVGMGRIGRRVARLLEALGMTVLGYDPIADPSPDATPAPDLDAGVAQADVISVHTPLSETTRGLIGAPQFAAMRDGVILVNCARGGVIDEPSLIAALTSGRVGMLGTDVFETEPIVADDPLLAAPNVVATAHTAAMTDASIRAMAMQSAENVLAALDGALSPDVVFNRAALEARAAKGAS